MVGLRAEEPKIEAEGRELGGFMQWHRQKGGAGVPPVLQTRYKHTLKLH